MIELKKKHKSDSKFRTNPNIDLSEYDIYIDGNLCENAYAAESYGSVESYGLSDKYVIEYFSDSVDSTRKLAREKFSEFLPFEYISLHNIFEWSDMHNSISIIQEVPHKLKIELRFQPDLTEWNQNYSFNKYFELLESERKRRDIKGKPLVFDIEEGDFWLSFETNVLDISILEAIQPYENLLKKVFDEVFITLLNRTYKTQFLFNFPEKLKVYCEQYLLYFAQFLQDLGINATSTLKDEAGKVLFSVTPTDDVEALDKIREALAVYLNLPSSPIVYNESFAATRLHQQIDNLQHSQRMAEREIRSSERELRLAQTVIEYQDKIILQKDTIIGQQNKVIEKITSKSIMMDSLENKAEFEKVFDGLEFGESKELKEKLGIKFNPITSLKSLGRKISGNDEEITSLNLNDKDTQ